MGPVEGEWIELEGGTFDWGFWDAETGEYLHGCTTDPAMIPVDLAAARMEAGHRGT